MKYLRVAIAYLLFLSTAHAQETHSYSVYLTAKENVQQLDHPQEFLSKRALLRREKQNIAVKLSDLPISPDRLGAIEHIVSYRGPHSKWLNSVYIEATSEEVVTLSELDFVQEIVPVSGHTFTTTSITLQLDHGYSFDQLDQIGLIEGLHNREYIGQDKLIAVLDAGFVGANSVEISQNLRILATRNFVEGGSNVYQGSSHGFSVLSAMASWNDGILIGSAPGAEYVLIKTERELSETPQEMYNWIAGAEYADSLGADIINSSLGYSEFDDPNDNYTVNDLDGRTSVISLGALAAARTGMLVVTSAGNAGGGPWNKITMPADADSILSVGSVNQYGIVSAFSSRGYTTDGRTKPNVCARGEGAIIYRSDGTLAAANGTSFSAPIIAGAAACLWQSMPSASPQAVLKAIEVSSSHYYQRNERIGYGIPNFSLARLYLNPNPETEIVVYPNPFPDYVTFFLPDDTTTEVDLELRDIYGRVVARENFSGRRYRFRWVPGDYLPSGTYFLHISRGNYNQVSQLIKI